MKISTEIGSIVKLVGREKAIQYVAEAGFDAWDFSMFDMCRYNRKTNECVADPILTGPDYLTYVRKLKQIGLDYGIECNQSHAPFPTNHPKIKPYMKRVIECSAEAGSKICIIHPMEHKSFEENIEFYQELLPFAKECGVKIATENMWDWDKEAKHSIFAPCATTEDFLAHLEAVRDESFVACLDIGHAEMKGSGSGAANMIRGLGKYLQALHIHDNDLLHDSHQIPFSMNIDFDEVVKALKEIDYQGYFTLEADSYLGKHCTDDVFKGVSELAASANRLRQMFEAL